MSRSGRSSRTARRRGGVTPRTPAAAQACDQPAVSVIIPVYNSADCLERTVQSVLAQSLRSLELILVDDGSDDGSQALCDAFAARDGRVRVIHQANAGVSAATNRGLDAARGEYVAFVDHDDYISVNFCERLYALAAAQQADISKGTSVRIHADGACELDAWMNRAIHEHESYLYFFGEWWTAIYRRALIEEHHLRLREDLILAHDLLFQLQAVLACRSLVTCEDAVYFWCYREGSTDFGTRGRSSAKIASVLGACTAIAAEVSSRQHELDPEGVANVFFQCIHRLASNANRADHREDAAACHELGARLCRECPPRSRAELQRLIDTFRARRPPASPAAPGSP